MCSRELNWRRGPVDRDVENDIRLANLELELDQALDAEDFSSAARLRDELLGLQSASSVEVLNANLKFFKSFDQGSLVDMAGCWLQDSSVTCKHPLGPLSVGYAPVLDSFAELFSEGVPDIVPRNVRISMRGSVALVTCEEVAMGESESESEAAAEARKHNPNFEFVTVSVAMLATNIFTKRNGQWYLQHHTSSPKYPSEWSSI